MSAVSFPSARLYCDYRECSYSEFNLSKSYLNAIFKKNTNTSLINYFIDMKMKEACKLLCSTTYTVKIIAADLGYFSYLFKKTVGVSPTEYRSSNKIFY